jgi:hypothetical protein
VTKPILVLDFDGVMHSYTSGWKGADVVPDPPVPGMVDFLIAAVEAFHVNVFSSRTGQPGGLEAMQNWLRVHVFKHFDCDFAGDPKDLDSAIDLLSSIYWPTEKPAAMVTIDDRAITFDGTWPTIATLLAFKPWNKK